MLYDLTLLLLAAYLASENVEALEETLVPVKKKCSLWEHLEMSLV